MKHSMIKSFAIASLLSIGCASGMEEEKNKITENIEIKLDEINEQQLTKEDIFELTENINKELKSEIYKDQSIEDLLKGWHAKNEFTKTFVSATITYIDILVPAINNFFKVAPEKNEYFNNEYFNVVKNRIKPFIKQLINSSNKIQEKVVKTAMEDCITKFGEENIEGCKEYQKSLEESIDLLLQFFNNINKNL